MGNLPSHRIVRLIDASDAARKLVSADIYRDYPSAELEHIEALWAGARDRAAAEGLASGLTSLEHSHWDWRNKVHSVEAGRHMLVVVECEGEAQGMMAVLQAPQRSRLSGKPLVYVDYLEAAPWNLKLLSVPPRYLGVGTVLIAEAVRLSLDTALEGRIGLHSLPQAEAFYKSRCGMTELGQDLNYFDLTYFEFTQQQAIEWLAAIGEL
jgi:hypothetical protein